MKEPLTPEEIEKARADAIAWKLGNPRSHLACGAMDRTARVPEPVHYDCRECHRRIVALLEMRIQRPHPVEHKQPRLPIMDEDFRDA